MRRRMLIQASVFSLLVGCGGEAVQHRSADVSAPTPAPAPAPAPAPGSSPSPIQIQADDSRQFLTWDGGSGPTREYWNSHLQLRWKNVGGDWLDATQTPNGAVPYATTSVGGPGVYSIDVTTLVSRWLAPGKNRTQNPGFLLKSNQNFPFYFLGRMSTNTHQRPTLVIKTDRGTFSVPPLANANWFASSAYASDTRERFSVKPSVLAIVLFDLSAVEGSFVQNATLTLTSDQADRAGTLSVFEADPPVFRVGGGKQTPRRGIADQYPLDKGLENHPSVLVATDFSDLTQTDWVGGCVDVGEPSQIYDQSTESTYVRGVIKAGDLLGSCNLSRLLVRGTADGTPERVERALYARYYVYLEDDWGSALEGNKMPGWDMRMGYWVPNQRGGYWQPTTGNGGSPGTGLKVFNASKNRWEYEGHSLRGSGGQKGGDGNYYDELFALKGYIYNLDQGGPYGEMQNWEGTVINKGRWTAIEQFVQLNSIIGPYDAAGNGTAVADGIYRVWVDGVLAHERTNMRWARHPEIGLVSFWLNWYHGGVKPAPHDMHYRMNSLVIARDYIGPRQDR